MDGLCTATTARAGARCAACHPDDEGSRRASAPRASADPPPLPRPAAARCSPSSRTWSRTPSLVEELADDGRGRAGGRRPSAGISLVDEIDEAEALVDELDREVHGGAVSDRWRNADGRPTTTSCSRPAAATTPRCASCSTSTAPSPASRPAPTSWSAPTARTSSRRA